MATSKVDIGSPAGFRHGALIYGSANEFLTCAAPFIAAGVEAGEPVLAAVDDRKAGLLRSALGSCAAAVEFVAAAELARNPARIIPFWLDFLEEHNGGPVRGVEEVMWPGRSEAEIEECERHESLLNLAFAGDAELSLLCAYDGSSLTPEVLREVAGCHRHVVGDEPHVPSDGEFTAARDCYAGRLPPPPVGAIKLQFDRHGLGEVRRRVKRAAEAGGLDRRAVADLVTASSELAANSVAHGGGGGTLRTWREADRLLVEVEDGGSIEDPLAGRLRPVITQEGGRGLWLANQLCDLVQIRSGASGTTVRLRAALA